MAANAIAIGARVAILWSYCRLRPPVGTWQSVIYTRQDVKLVQFRHSVLHR